MRKFLVFCMVAAMALFCMNDVYATFDLTQNLKADSLRKKLDFDGYTYLNDIVITQNVNWAAGDVLEVNFDLCAIDVGPAGTPADNYYKLPYVVNWASATTDPISTTPISVVNVFYDAAGVAVAPFANVLRSAAPRTSSAMGDGARALITAGSATNRLRITGITANTGVQIIQNIFPWLRNYVVRASFFGAANPPTGVPSVPNFFCNPRFYHPANYILATYGVGCETFLKFGFVIGYGDYTTILVVSSDLSTTCRDGVVDTVEFYAWNDSGAFGGKADGTYSLVNPANSIKSHAQAFIGIGYPGFTWAGKSWADATGGIGQVIARAKQPFAHGVALLMGPQGIQSSYLALHDPSISSIDTAGNVRREDWYNFAEPYLGYIH
jgi:hypothetical protein